MKIKSFQDIIAWQKAQDLAAYIYKVTETMKDYGFRNQYQKAAVSISSNIAEGFDRKTPKQFHQFLTYASGSCSEVASLTLLADKIRLISDEVAEHILAMCAEISKIIGGLLRHLKTKIS